MAPHPYRQTLVWPKTAEVRAFVFAFHTLGSIVSSSCLCESAGSLLKHFARGNADTKRFVERALLKFAGIAGDGTDGLILLRAWLETVPSPEKLVFMGRNMKAYNKKVAQFPLGEGSKTLHNMRKAAGSKSERSARWSASRLRRIPRVAAKVLATRLRASLHRWARTASQKGSPNFSSLKSSPNFVVPRTRVRKSKEKSAGKVWATSDT